jgi:hypothetical protein
MRSIEFSGRRKYAKRMDLFEIPPRNHYAKNSFSNFQNSQKIKYFDWCFGFM